MIKTMSADYLLASRIINRHVSNNSERIHLKFLITANETLRSISESLNDPNITKHHKDKLNRASRRTQADIVRRKNALADYQRYP